jgi:HTH-type transcriptional regulator/antitoxin HigA
MSTAVAFDSKKYARLLTKALPLRIETEEEYERLLKQAEQLMEREEDALSVEEERLLDLLTDLIERYEDERYPMNNPKPHEMLRFLMEQRGLRQRDLSHLFGSRGTASEVINGKRAISKAQAKKLAEFFHVTPDVFI